MAFEPRDAEAAGQQIRNITVSGVDRLRYGATLWPSHAHVKVEQGDVVTLEGSYNQRTRTNDETGETTKFHNISVTRIKIHGAADQGKKNETVNTEPEASDDDIPF